MKIESTGPSLIELQCRKAAKRSWQFGPSNENDIQMAASTNTKQDFAHMEDSRFFGENYWDTYAPVVTWASVRLLLIIAKIHNPDSKTIDFVLAFPQADLDVPVYMELPVGLSPDNEGDDFWRRYVLRLNKSLYGLKQAGHNWFQKLSKGLIDRLVSRH